MLRRVSAPRKHRTPASPPRIRLNLEQLEEREVLDAALVQGFDFLAVSAYQTARQLQSLQATTQSDLTHFQQDSTAYTAGNGVTSSQINQDNSTLQQDANAIQGLNATFQQDLRFFFLGLMTNVGNFSSSDSGTLLADAYFLNQGKGFADSAMQIASTASAVQLPSPPAAANPPVKNPSLPSSSGSSSSSSTSTDPQLATLTLNPLNVNLLGLNLQTNQIQINIAAQSGNGDLLGNVLTDTSNLLNTQAVSAVVNQVLGSAVSLLNSGSLSVAGVNTSSGPLSSPSAGATSTSPTSVLTLQVAPVTLNLMGAEVTTSPIQLTLTAQAGQGLVLGNVVTDLANLFNPPLPSHLSLAEINGKLGDLVQQLNQQIPDVGTTPPPVTLSNGQFLDAIVPPINLNLLGLLLQTSPIQVTAANQTGNGDLLGNIGTTLLNTVDATPQNLTTFNNDLNAILGKVIGVLNASTLTLPADAISSLPLPLQQLTSPTLVNTSGSPATVPILNLAIASPDNSTPVNVDLLGLQIATSNIQAQLLAQTGDGQILGNLLYNLSNLLNPGGTASLLPILTELGL